MKTTLWSLLVPSLLAVGLVRPTPPPTPLGPDRQIVGFSESYSGLALPPGGELTIFTVPANRLFVLTDISLKRHANGSDAQWLSVRQSLNGNLSRKIGRGVLTSGWDVLPEPTGSTGFHCGTGVPFEPGSEVVLFNSALNPLTMTDVRLEFLGGYLVPAN